MDPIIQEETMASNSNSFSIFYPVNFVLDFLTMYGWTIVGSCSVALYIWHKLQPTIEKWREARDDAKYHKDPDTALARMEAIQRARELQQQKLIEASERALALLKEREERKRQETIERLEKYGSAAGGQRLGSDDDYLPLSGGASTSSYRAPKRSKCGGGGCGK